MRKVLCFLLSVLFLSCSDFFEWGFAKNLPEGAEIINQNAVSDDFFPDYDYLLVARMNESDFYEYIEHYDMHKHVDGATYEDHEWQLEFLLESKYDWWQPAVDGESFPIYISQQKQEWIIATYQDGLMYLHSQSH